MNVPPLYKLIVCVIPPQTIVRQCVLAAVSYVSVLCGAARAQSVPAAPPLTLWNAVELRHSTEVEKTYTLEYSNDLSLWTATAPTIYGNGGEVAQWLPAEAAAQGYYRLKVETMPREGKARWSMKGCRMVFNSAAGSCNMQFSDDAAGTMTDGSAVTNFTWEWKRTGADHGQATITWPNRTVETLEMQFIGEHIGAYSGQRTADGVPVAASSGTFRDEFSTALAQSVPSSVANRLLTFSGSGRPLGLEIGADGTAVIPGPAGTKTFGSSYAVTGAGQAKLTLTANGGVTERWELDFSGPSCGTYTCIATRNGTLRRTARGSFTIAER